MKRANQSTQPPALLTREKIYWISAALCLTVAPHVLHLPIWLLLFIGMLLGFKLISLRKNPKLSKLTATVLTLLAIIIVLLNYGKILGRDAGVALLSIMLFLKLLEARTRRDGMILILFTYFLIITNFLYSQAILMAGYMLFAVLITTLTLIALNQHHNLSLQTKLKLSARLILPGIPIMLILFILFPRIPGPLWGLPVDAYSGRTGLSENMTPGAISELALSDEIAFRVKFSGTHPPTRALYWRAGVLWQFDGLSWKNNFPTALRASDIMDATQPIDYTITLEPHNKTWLFLLDIPATHNSIPNALPLYQDYTQRTQHPISTLKQYSARSFLSYRINQDLSPLMRYAATQIPSNFNPQAIKLAENWKSSGKRPVEIINAALHMFNQRFIYTLKPPQLDIHTVDDFLFKTQRGFCEHYAGSFVFLMRAAGIPARVVIGYQGGEINPLDGYLIVRQSDAHAWAEVWIQNAGWVRIDPTAEVSPERIETGLDAAVMLEENPRLILARNNPLFAGIRTIMDASNNRWNQWVLGYSNDAQQRFLTELGLSKKHLEHLLLITVVITSVLFMIGALLILRTKHPTPANAAIQLYTVFCKKLAAQGVVRATHEGPVDFAARACQAFPAWQREIQTITQLFITLQYKTNATGFDQIRYLRRRVGNLKLKKTKENSTSGR